MRNALLLAALTLAFLWWFLTQDGGADGLTNDDAETDANGFPPITEGGQVADITAWANVIKQREGWKPGTRAYRNNNPGNLVGNVSGSIGTDADGFAIFPSESAGMEALKSDLTAKTRKYSNFSLLQIMTRYLGGDPANVPADGNVYVNGKLQGNSKSYAQQIATALGVSISDTLGAIFG